MFATSLESGGGSAYSKRRLRKNGRLGDISTVGKVQIPISCHIRHYQKAKSERMPIIEIGDHGQKMRSEAERR